MWANFTATHPRVRRGAIYVNMATCSKWEDFTYIPRVDDTKCLS